MQELPRYGTCTTSFPYTWEFLCPATLIHGYISCVRHRLKFINLVPQLSIAFATLTLAILPFSQYLYSIYSPSHHLGSKACTAQTLPSKMKFIQFLTLGVASLASGLPLDNNLEKRASCATGVHIIVARASTEAQGEGIIGAVASDIKTRIPGSDDVAIVYPALLEPYPPSEADGVSAMTSSIQSYVAQCPSTKIVLLGYSQACHHSSSSGSTTLT